MTQDEIRTERQRLNVKLIQAQKMEKIVRAEMGVLYVQCSHPNSYAYTVMGDPGRRCPDCGWAT